MGGFSGSERDPEDRGGSIVRREFVVGRSETVAGTAHASERSYVDAKDGLMPTGVCWEGAKIAESLFGFSWAE